MKCVGPHLLTEKKLNLCGRSGRINNRINRCSNIFCYRCIEVGYMNQGLHRPLYLTILSSHTGLRGSAYLKAKLVGDGGICADHRAGHFNAECNSRALCKIGRNVRVQRLFARIIPRNRNISWNGNIVLVVLFRAFCSDNGLGILWRNLMARPIRILTVQLLNLASYSKSGCAHCKHHAEGKNKSDNFFHKNFLLFY